jgi:hypothetical protein
MRRQGVAVSAGSVRRVAKVPTSANYSGMSSLKRLKRWPICINDELLYFNGREHAGTQFFTTLENGMGGSAARY